MVLFYLRSTLWNIYIKHHGALYSDIFKTSLFDFSLANQYTLSPINIRKSVECLCFWNDDF